jgi:hypothetical protein
MNPYLIFMERFIQTKAQVPNAPEETVIAIAMEGLATGQCAAHFAMSYPTSIRQYARSDDDLKKRKATRNSWRQSARAANAQLNGISFDQSPCSGRRG